MLFSLSDVRDSSPGSVFQGWGNTTDFDWSSWESRIPSLQTQNFFSGSDPSMYNTLFGSSESGAKSFVEEMASITVVSALRNVVARASMAWGWFSKALKPVKHIFEGLVSTVGRVLAGVNAAFKAISLAIDAISWVPVIGWILAIIKLIANVVVGIVKDVKEKKQAKRDKVLAQTAKVYGLPIGEWHPDIDTFMCQYLQRQLEDMNLEWCFMPRYPAKRPEDFFAQRQKFEPSDNYAAAWLIFAGQSYDNVLGSTGLGFVPGTDSIHGAIQLPAWLPTAVQDMGAWFPMTQATVFQIWNQVIKGDSGMTFAVDAGKCISAWESYISAAYEYGTRGIAGWTLVTGETERFAGKPTPFGYVTSDFRYRCSQCDYGRDNCNKHHDGKWKEAKRNYDPDRRFANFSVKREFEGHREPYLKYLHELFDWKESMAGKPLHKDDWWKTTRPVRALQNLEERQKAMIMSPTCMYLDDSTDSDGRGHRRFNAIRKGTPMHALWDKCVTAMFESGDWKRIDYRDVIKGEEVDAGIRTIQHLKNTLIWTRDWDLPMRAAPHSAFRRRVP